MKKDQFEIYPVVVESFTRLFKQVVEITDVNYFFKGANEYTASIIFIDQGGNIELLTINSIGIVGYKDRKYPIDRQGFSDVFWQVSFLKQT